MSQLDDIDYKKLRENNFKDFITENELADKSLVKFLEDVDIKEKTLESYQKYLIETGKSTSAFTSFTKKAGIALKTLGAAMASMAINWAIGKIIDIAVTAWEHFNVTVKEVQENIDNLTSNIESLNTELDELNSKSNLTDAEQERLKYLETRISLEERLLKIEQARLASEQLGKPSKITDWFDEDSYVKKASLEFGEDAVKRPMSALGVLSPEINNLINLIPLMNNISAHFNGAEAVIKKGNEQYEELEYLNNKYEQLIKERDAFEVGSHDWQVGDKRVARIASELEAYQKQVTSGSYADLLEKYGQYTKEIENLEGILENSDYLSADEIEYSQKLLDLYSSNAKKMKELINNIAISLGDQSLWIGTDLELLDSKTDILTADVIQSNFTDEEIKILAYLDFDRDASISTLRSLLEEEQEIADDEPFKFSSVLSDESLSKFQSTIDSLKSSLTTLYNGDYSSTDLISALTNINKALSDIGKADVLNWEEITNIDDLDNVIDQITNEYVDGMLKSLDMAGTDFGDTIRNVIQEELKASRQLETYKSNVSDLQTAYSNLTDVIETYNANGYITFDQLTSLLEMEPQYLSCLIDDSGQLQLNTQAMADLAQLRLDEARAQVVQEAISELNRLSEEKQTQAVNDNSNAYIENENTIKHWNDTLYTAMQNAGLAVPLFAELSTALGGAVSKGVSDEEINQVLDNAYKQFKFIGQMESSIGSNLGDVLGKAGSGSSSTTSDFSETIDFFERRVEELKNALSLLDSTMDNVAGSFGKNNLVDAKLGITEEEFKNYTDALSMYTQKATEAFSKIPADIASKVKDGAVALTDFIGDDNKDVVEAIKEYESWTDKISDCKQELTELQKEIRQLELEKFNNIMDDIKNQFDLRDDSKNLISKQIDILKEAGELIGESFFTAQIDQSKKQLELLESEKAQLVNQMSSAISSGRIQAGTDEWLEMVNALSDVDGSILDCKKSIEEFDNSILELHTEIFDRIQDQFSNLNSEISNIIDLFDEFEVSDDKGIWSKEAIAQLGLLSQQYELAQYRVQQYNDEINELNAQYLAGKYSATEYADKLAELNSEQWNAIKTAESAKDALMDLNETRIENQIKGIEKEIDAYKELTDSQISALKASKDLHDYEKSIAEKTKSITDLERQIAAMQNDTSAATVAKHKKLEEQLAEAKKDLEEAEYDHSIEAQEDALNKQYEQYEKERNDEITALRESLNDKETILAESFNTVKANASLVGQEIAIIATQHGITVSNSLISSWQSGENAIASYGEVLSQNTSVFIGNIMDVENEVWNLQAQANTTADSLAWMFSTSADNLVNELNTSYFAEANLANMTNALQQSLVNTLERGYDVSSIVNSLNAVTDAANKARTAVGGIGGNSPTTSSVPTGFNDLDVSRKYFVKDENNKTLFVGSPSQCQTWVSAHNYSLGSIVGDDINVTDNNRKSNVYSSTVQRISSIGTNIAKASLKKYASGTRNIKEDQLAITNEAGQELIYHAADGSILTPLRQGDKVFSNEAVERLWEIGQGLMPPDIFKNLAMPTVLPNNVNNNSVNVHYDSMITVQGSLNSTDVKQMEAIANKAVDRMVDKIHDGITYGR